MRILIIEDEQDLARALKRGFDKSGYLADAASDGLEGLAMAQMGEYDLIVLDLNLPGMDGLDILRTIRQEDKAQRVLILSARSDFSQRIDGLDMGANDYLVKPFDFGELMARVRSLLRRSFVQQDVQIPFFGFTLNTATRSVTTSRGEPLDLAPKEMAILEYLVLKRGSAVSAEEIIGHVWQDDSSLFSNSVKVHISTLRKKLSAHCPQEIITSVRGSGYLLKGEDLS